MSGAFAILGWQGGLGRTAAARRRLEARFAADPALARAWPKRLAREVQRGRWRAGLLSIKTVAERLDAWLALDGGGLPARGAHGGEYHRKLA